MCEENILEVLRVLKPFKDVHADYKHVVSYVMAMVKHSKKMLSLVCSNLASAPSEEAADDLPEHAYDDQLTSPMNTSLHDVVYHEKNDRTEVVSACHSDTAAAGEKQPQGSQTDTARSNAGPSHTQSDRQSEARIKANKSQLCFKHTRKSRRIQLELQVLQAWRCKTLLNNPALQLRCLTLLGPPRKQMLLIAMFMVQQNHQLQTALPQAHAGRPAEID